MKIEIQNGSKLVITDAVDYTKFTAKLPGKLREVTICESTDLTNGKFEMDNILKLWSPDDLRKPGLGKHRLEFTASKQGVPDEIKYAEVIHKKVVNWKLVIRLTIVLLLLPISIYKLNELWKRQVQSSSSQTNKSVVVTNSDEKTVGVDPTSGTTTNQVVSKPGPTKPVEGLVGFAGNTTGNNIQILAVNGTMNVVSNGVDVSSQYRWPKNTPVQKTETVPVTNGTNEFSVQYEIQASGDTEFILPAGYRVDSYIRVKNSDGTFSSVSESDYDLSQDRELINNGSNSTGYRLRLR